MRIGVKGFHGARLVQARFARAMTQTALAAASGVSSSTISKWEHGEQMPEFGALERVAAALDIPSPWFLKPLPRQADGAFFFRSNASLAATARAVAQTRLEWLHELSLIMQEWIDWPSVSLPARLTRGEALSITDADIEALAAKCREHWRLGLGPIDDVLRVMESAGIIVMREALGFLKMDGVSRWFDDEGRPYVFISADKASAVRNRFDASHELGHILMHSNLYRDDYDQHYDELERQAHLFASAFLLPAESVAVSLSYPTLDTLLSLKKRWKVSIGALIMRAKSLELIDDAYATRLFKNYSARGWRKGEPLDDVLVAESPRLMPRAIRMLLEDGGFSKHRLIETAGLSAVDVEKLCTLPEGYMSDQMAKVIPLNSPVFRSSASTPKGEPGVANVVHLSTFERR